MSEHIEETLISKNLLNLLNFVQHPISTRLDVFRICVRGWCSSVRGWCSSDSCSRNDEREREIFDYELSKINILEHVDIQYDLSKRVDSSKHPVSISTPDLECVPTLLLLYFDLRTFSFDWRRCSGGIVRIP
jgi:hypothetical protein